MRPGRLLLRAMGGGLALLALGFVGFAATLSTAETPTVRHADGLVVLTGGADRVSDALELLSQGLADRLLVSGVNPTTSPADIARLLPGSGRYVDCCVTLGYRALDTAGNATETAQWAAANNIRSLIVVTSNYHMPRALAEMSHTLPGVDLVAYPVVSDAARDAPWWSSLQRARLIASEYLKYIVVVARHALLPSPAPEGPTVVAERAA